MQFVKSSVYQAEITEGGVREREVDTRSREEVELQERLRKLPEFSRDPNFKSYAEQVLEGLPPTTPEPPPPTEGKPNPNLPHSVTEEEFEFYEALRAQDRRKKLARQKEEDEMRDEFHRAREASLRLSVSSVASSNRDRRSAESDTSQTSLGKPSPFSVLAAQKYRSKISSPFGEGCIFDVTTIAFKEKQKKRALDARPSLNLIIKKPKTNAAESTVSNKAEDSATEDAKKDEDNAADVGGSKSEDKQDWAKAAADTEKGDVFASLCEAYGDSDDSG
ncbi:hypothetical protein, conserved [Eimeria tenella]|uniref:Uncharacterized protein n=1 Tax=Eimeria tenella TaxID=5802 RepID=U6KZ64_EIMTE|nr:hypothetical protein, conserved [Eimeria tenella]CDJ42228.1 hypothetical protein, conserved [Eimeria tenella]|eukprot:XP_013232978.1 hypothetical protein, conserved [Eimeria tenella]